MCYNTRNCEKKIMIRLEQVSKIYNNDGVTSIGIQNISCEFKLGEFVAITGESGSGKSTMLNVITMMDSYEEGELFIDGKSTVEFSKEDFANYRANYVSFIFQEYNLVDSFTVLENVMLPLLARGIKRREAKRIALEAIEKVDLKRVIKHKATQLSGGEKQRTVIARALVSDTPIIACDEPTGNLDSETSKQIVNLLASVAPNKLVLYVTHDYRSIEHVATRHITMNDSHIESDVILKETKQDITIGETKKAKTSFPTILDLGAKDVLATPKKSLLSFLISFVVSLSAIGILAGAFSLIEPASKNISDSANTYADTNAHSKNRVVAFGKGRDNLELSNFAIGDDVFVDYGNILASQSSYTLMGTSGIAQQFDVAQIDLLSSDYELVPSLGRLPETTNGASLYYECGLAVSKDAFSNYATNRDAALFFKTKFFGLDGVEDEVPSDAKSLRKFSLTPAALKSKIKNLVLTPTCILLVDTTEYDYSLVVTKQTMNKIYETFSAAIADSETNCREGISYAYMNESVYSLNNISVNYNPNAYNLIKKDGDPNVDYSKIYIPTSFVGFDLNISIRGASVTIPASDPVFSVCENLDNAIYMHQVAYLNIFAKSKQIASFYTDNPSSANKVLKGLLNDRFLAYNSASPQSSVVTISAEGYQNMLLIIAYSAAFLVSAILIAFLGSLILGIIYNSRKKDYAIYLSLSFSRNSVRFINLVEMMIFFILTSILSYVVIYFVSKYLALFFYSMSLTQNVAIDGIVQILQSIYKFAVNPIFIVIYFAFNLLFAFLVSTWIMNKFAKKTLANNLRKGGELL